MAWNRQIPFNADGDMCDYVFGTMAPSKKGYTSVVWQDVAPFEATLEYVGSGRGRSAVTFTWKDPDGHTYPMFLRDMDDCVRKGIAAGGVLKGTFIGCKRGANYGIKLVEGNDDHSGTTGTVGED